MAQCSFQTVALEKGQFRHTCTVCGWSITHAAPKHYRECPGRGNPNIPRPLAEHGKTLWDWSLHGFGTCLSFLEGFANQGMPSVPMEKIYQLQARLDLVINKLEEQQDQAEKQESMDAPEPYE